MPSKCEEFLAEVREAAREYHLDSWVVDQVPKLAELVEHLRETVRTLGMLPYGKYGGDVEWLRANLSGMANAALNKVDSIAEGRGELPEVLLKVARRYAKQREVCGHDDGSWCDESCPDAGRTART